MRLLLDEMYPAALAEALTAAGHDAVTVLEAGLNGRADADVFAAAVEQSRATLTENVGDFARIAAEHLDGGAHHPGVLIALGTRFSRRPAGIGPLVDAIGAVGEQPLEDLVHYLKRAGSGAGWGTSEKPRRGGRSIGLIGL